MSSDEEVIEQKVLQMLSPAVALAVAQTTLADHERRLTITENNQAKVMFWLVAATCSSFASLCSGILIFALEHHP